MSEMDEARYRELMGEALVSIEALQKRVRELEGVARESIAIVGLGCRFPGAGSPDEFWRLLRDGVDAVGEIPRSRWDIDAFYDPNPDTPGTMYTRSGGFLRDIEQFDAVFFGISPREAMTLDPQQRLLLETAWEALEHAGIAPDSLSGSRSGVFVGIGGVDYYQRLVSRPPAAIDAYVASGNAHSTASGRLSYLLGLEGPSMSIDTACSSSLVAAHLACQSLRQRECDLALAGGVNVMLSPSIHLNHCRARLLAPDGRCKAFDASADGFIRSEGCGIVVLRRLSDARRDGDRILAVIRGTAVNQDGRTSALTVPSGRAQQAVIRAALADAGLEPAAVSYVEAHGTGTALGDPIEAGALASVFAGHREPVLVGSVKANIGHAEAAAGVAGLMKVVLSMAYRELPPQLHFKTLNPRIPADVPFRVATAVTAWGARDRSLYAGVSSFGFGGTNAHLVLEGPPLMEDTAEAGPPRNLLVLSARTPNALRALAETYRSPAATAPLADLCFSAATGRTHFAERLAIAANDSSNLLARLDSFVNGQCDPRVWAGNADAVGDARVAFLYTGQGSQYWGMGDSLYDGEPVFRSALDACAANLDPHLDRPLQEILFGADRTAVDQTASAQPALFAIEYALTEWWASVGVTPSAVLGHSVGEYAAACAAGVMKLADACRLIALRGRLMQRQPAGRMVAVLGDVTRVRRLLESHGEVSVAAINTPTMIVVSGPCDTIARVSEDLDREGLIARPLTVSHAFHSAMMDPMLDEFRRAADGVSYSRPAIDIVSNVTGGGIERYSGDYWATHLRQPVLFAEGIRTLWAKGYRVFLEIGPQPTLTTLGPRCLPEAADARVWTASLERNRDDLDALREGAARLSVSGAAIDWRRWYGSTRRNRIALPTYPFQRQRYWVDADPSAPPRKLDTLAYTVGWEAIERAAGESDAFCAGAWLVFADAGGTSSGIVASLCARGATVEVIASGVEDVRRIRDLERTRPLAGVLYCRALDAPASSQLDAGALYRTARTDCAQLARVIRELGDAASRARVWVVTRGAVHAVRDDDRDVQVAQSPLWGFGQVVALEHPDRWGGLIDLDPRAPAAVFPLLALGESADDQIAVRDGRIYGARLRSRTLDAREIAVRSDATYLITGGGGALGLAAAEWLVERGARHLALVGRREPAPGSLERIEALRRRHVTIDFACADVGDVDAMRRVLDPDVPDRPPLAGIIHAAGVNGVSPVAGMDEGQLGEVLSAKTRGAWVLHDLTRDRPLDFFVLFSSIASIWGSKGQAHYAAANRCLDALAAYRSGMGLPATSIAWGPWAGGGMATDQARDWLSRSGVSALTRNDGLAALGSLMRAPGDHIVARVDWPRFLELYEVRRARALFTAQRPARAADGTHALATSGGVVNAIKARGPENGRRYLVALVTDELVDMLKLERSNAPMPHQGFFTIGMDSLLALEFRNRLAATLNVALPATLAFDYPNIRALAEYLARDVVRVDPEAVPGVPAVEAATDVSALRDPLPDDVDVAAAIATTLRRLDRLMDGT